MGSCLLLVPAPRERRCQATGGCKRFGYQLSGALVWAHRKLGWLTNEIKNGGKI